MSKDVVKELYVVDGGYMDIDKGLMTADTNLGKWIKIPVPILVVKTTEGVVLIDTGMNPEVIELPENAWSEWLAKDVSAHMTRENDLVYNLSKLGIKPDDVKYVINTHMHHDNIGANRLFTKARHYVQKAEYRFAMYPDEAFSSRYTIKTDLPFDLDWVLIEGETEILPGITVIPSPGHTPGHQSILFDDIPGVGPLLYCGDAVYLAEDYENDSGPDICWNPHLAIESMHHLKEVVKKTGAYVMYSHDWDYFYTLPLSPEKFSIPR